MPRIASYPEATTIGDTDEFPVIVAGDLKLVKRQNTGQAKQADLAAHIADTTNPHATTKAQVGLGNADNTSDLAKPVSTATQTALNGKANTVHTHVAADVTDLQAAVSANTDVTANTSARHTHANKTVLDATTASYTTADDTKLAGIATGATSNSTDAFLLNRANHTGSQTSVTISDFATAADARIANAAGNSIASLSGGKVPTSQLPAVSLTSVQTAASQAAMLALTTQEGDVVVRTDISQTYMRNAGTTGTMSDFTLLDTPADAVTSVNGQTGTVVLAKGDVGLGNVDNTSDATKNAATATLTNKTISGATNTLSNIPESAVTNLSTDLAAKEPSITAGTASQYWRGDKSFQTLDKTAVGLANVDNTSDVNKPVSTAQQTALNAKAPLASPAFTGTATGTFEDKGGHVYNILAYGGVADGVTDNTTAFNAAITAMGGNGGTLFLPPGTYAKNLNSSVPDNVTVLGVPGKTIIKTTSTLPGGATRSPVEIGFSASVPVENVTIQGIQFDIETPNGALNIQAYKNLTIRDCMFTGAGAGGHIITIQSVTDCTGLKFVNNKFVNITNMPAMYLRPSNLKTISDSLIQGNRFENIWTTGIQIDDGTGGMVRNTRIVNNSFVDLVSGTTTGQWGVAIYGGLNSAYIIENLLVEGNHYRNTLTAASQGQGFVWIYQSKDVRVLGNTAITTSSATTNVIAIAPGRVSNPLIGFQVKNNYFEGWGAYWDPDSMQHVEFSDNIIRNCGDHCLLVGYGTQDTLDIHDNLFYNCTGSSIPAFIGIGNSSPVRVKVHDNTFIEDTATPTMTYCIETTGNSTYDSSGVEIYRNKFYLPNGTITEFAHKQFSPNTLPRIIQDNELRDSTGYYREFPYAQGNVTGATTFDRALGSIVTATLTGNITVTLTSGSRTGETLELRLTQDATGSRTVTWPGNFKPAGGSLTLSTTASALDVVVMQWDGTNWRERSRILSAAAVASTTWGSITGTLSSQTDLNTALNAKATKGYAIAMAVAL